MKVPILMYHRIVPYAEAGNSIRDLVVPPDIFAAQLDALEHAGWSTITMAGLAAYLQAGKRPPAKTFVITIDDGWDDGYTYALPILNAHDYVATYFVIAGRIDTPDFLSSTQLLALIDAGNEIGDHTLDHTDLAGVSAARAKFEIDVAAARIAQVTGHWPASLAYPSGGVDQGAEAAVAACGELRTAVIEGPSASPSPSPSHAPAPTSSPKPAPSASVGPAAVPSAAATSVWRMPDVYEAWPTRWTIPRLRLSSATTPAYLVSVLGHYA